MKVLFCTDGSIISYNSILNLSRWTNDLVIDVICAADWNFLPDSIIVEDGEFALKCTNSVNAILSYCEKYLLDNGLKIRHKISMCGNAIDCILDIHSKDIYDAIVLGSNGKKGVQKWLGSVSQEVLSSSKISNYIAKEKNQSKKVLFATDYSDISKHVIETAIIQLDLVGKEIYIVTVYEPPDYLFLEGNINSSWINDTNKKQEISAYKLLNEFKLIFESNHIAIKDEIVLSGNPAEEIIKFANDRNIDLVICGIRNRNKLARFLLSSVSKRILENTRADVYIIRPNNL